MSLSFICPSCRALLKIRDESFVGTELECPECKTALLVTKPPTGEIIGQEIRPSKTQSATSHTPGKQRTSASKPNPAKVAKPATADPAVPEQAPTAVITPATPQRTPHIVAWVVAGVCLLGLIPFLIPGQKPDQTGAHPQEKRPDKGPAKPEDKPKLAQVAPSKPPPAPQKTFPETPAGRLEALGKLVLEQTQTEGHFPAGTVAGTKGSATQRWSWLAQIAAKQDNATGLPIDWTQRWNDPSQDRFVRRPITRFQNPLVATVVSEDRYPATHFVGVAGVGADAPTLSADHSRAGIFGQDRQTKMDQIRDGVSHTMLLAGVENQLGSWAAGTTSYRPFTQAPYIQGPDGFGTGQPDRMLVLMADGSVREINRQTDPRIVRRMAAMNDGFPLDTEVPGEPGDPRPGTVPIPDPLTAKVNPTSPPTPDPSAVKTGAPTPNPAEKPLERPVEQTVDIPAALSRKILKFDQSKPAAAFQLLLQIEELAGVRIEYDREKLGTAAQRLDKQIILRKDNATLEELLDDVLQQIDLHRKSEATAIRIVTTEST